MPDQDVEYTIHPSRWIAISAIMTALALVASYSTVGIPNVELASAILFLTAFIFEYEMAVFCTLLMSVIYSTLNPWGAFIPQIWLSQVVGWLFIAIVGAILGGTGPDIRILKPDRSSRRTTLVLISISFTGAIMTVVFDLITTLGFSWASGIPYSTTLVTLIPFMLIHVVSNAILFPIVIPALETTLKREFGSEIWTSSNMILGEE